MPRNPEIKLGWTLPQRKKILEDVSSNQSEKHKIQIKFQGKQKPLPVFSVDVDLPKYRLANGRTQAAQEEYLAKHRELGDDFFIRDMESDSAQSVQHDLLWEMVNKTDLYAYFKNTTNSQDEPLILSHNGFVVNGNRRLCAMRELYYADRIKYSKYSHIDAVVLPFCSEQDIDELEAYLQIQPDIKADYTWIAKACMLRARQERHKYTEEQLHNLYDIPEKDVRTILSQLSLVDEYLESRGKSKEYDLVEKDDFAFRELLKNKQLIKEAQKKDFFTQIVFCTIDAGDAIEGRLYQRIPDIRQNLDQIKDELGNELDLKIAEPKPNSNYGSFGVIVDTQLSPFINAVSQPENRAKVIDVCTDVIERQKENQKTSKKFNAVIKLVADANANLKSALNSITPETNKQGIDEQLVAIENSIKKIRDWLSENA